MTPTSVIIIQTNPARELSWDAERKVTTVSKISLFLYQRRSFGFVKFVVVVGKESDQRVNEQVKTFIIIINKNNINKSEQVKSQWIRKSLHERHSKQHWKHEISCLVEICCTCL